MRIAARRRCAAVLLCALIVPMRPALAQRSSPVRVRDFRFAERRLTRPEVAAVVEAASEELAGGPFSVANTLGVRMEFMLDAHSHLHFARNPADRVLTEYTARVARYCDDGRWQRTKWPLNTGTTMANGPPQLASCTPGNPGWLSRLFCREKLTSTIQG